MEIKIQTLTPLWTGGIDGKCDRLYETGILGSLRWWMEVLVRGVGGEVCDPTEQKCSRKNGLCPVCEIFGAEGQKRSFRLEIIQDTTQGDQDVSKKVELNSCKYSYIDKQGKNQTKIPTWHFLEAPKDKPRSGNFVLKIQKLNRTFDPKVICGLIQFMADWSALGARPQMGFGVIKVEDDHFDTKPLYDWLQKIPKTSNNCQDLPSLKNIFFAQIQTNNSEFDEKSTFNLKYDLRQLFRTDQQQSTPNSNKPILKKNKEQELRHFIMGAAPKNSDKDKKDQRMAAKIKMSRPYQDESGNTVMRVWGWIPETADCYNDHWDRDKILTKVHEHLKSKYTLSLWREFDSKRDTEKPNLKPIDQFLGSLLKCEDNQHD